MYCFFVINGKFGIQTGVIHRRNTKLFGEAVKLSGIYIAVWCSVKTALKKKKRNFLLFCKSVFF